ncbi:MAG: P-loop NTPase fold protein [Opitutales bacterium]
MQISEFKEDFFGLESFAVKLEQLLLVEREFVDDGLVVSLNAPFGCGKSTFLKMWLNRIRNKESQFPEGSMCVNVNAWESDYLGDPLFSVVTALLSSFGDDSEQAKQVRDAFKDVGWFIASAGSQAAWKLTGINPVVAGDLAERKRKERGADEIPADFLALFEMRRRAMSHLKSELGRLVAGSGHPVFVFIDELDRCRPDYAVAYLETIKHVFDIKGLIFILSIDKQQIESSCKIMFGPSLNFEEYFRKFVHRDFNLRTTAAVEINKTTAIKYAEYYLNRDGLRRCGAKIDANYIELIGDLISKVGLSLRQTQAVFRTAGYVLQYEGKGDGSFYFIIGVSAIFMATMRTVDPEAYHKIGAKTFSPEEAYFLVFEKLKVGRNEWWFNVLFLGRAMRRDDRSAEEVFESVGLAKPDFRGWHSVTDDYTSNWFQRAYRAIEEAGKITDPFD